MYDPHEKPDYADEEKFMSRGRLIKARLEDMDPPNVSWFWIQIGNCLACQFFEMNKCANPKISSEDFYYKYLYETTCPEFKAGVHPLMASSNPGRQDALDVMKAAGIVSGTPSQKVKIIRNEEWSINLAKKAHKEQSAFMQMAMQVDVGGNNDPNRGEYVNFEDDLEREGTGGDAESPEQDEGDQEQHPALESSGGPPASPQAAPSS